MEEMARIGYPKLLNMLMLMEELIRIEKQLVDTFLHWWEEPLRGVQKSSLLQHYQLPKQNMSLQPTQQSRYYGTDTYSKSLESLYPRNQYYG
jgi:hypothetical protein